MTTCTAKRNETSFKKGNKFNVYMLDWETNKYIKTYIQPINCRLIFL